MPPENSHNTVTELMSLAHNIMADWIDWHEYYSGRERPALSGRGGARTLAEIRDTYDIWCRESHAQIYAISDDFAKVFKINMK